MKCEEEIREKAQEMREAEMDIWIKENKQELAQEFAEELYPDEFRAFCKNAFFESA